MKYKITKLDRRHNGYNFYKYYIDPSAVYSPEKIGDFVDLRNWCWATYGPSAELGFTKLGSVWAWDSEYKKKRIFLKSDAELTLFRLKFS